MKRLARQKLILDMLQADPILGVASACQQLGASPATVRREFAGLVAAGRVEKTWGGIMAPSISVSGPAAFTRRLSENTAEKRRIAQASSALLSAGDVVMIDGGTTTFLLCEFIALKQIRIITNSVVIAQEVDRLKGAQRGAEIYLTGGILTPESSVLSGPPAEAFLSRYHADWAFLSAAGLTEQGATNYREAVLASERLMIAQSKRVVLLVDHSKLGRRAMCALCPLGEITDVFTSDTELAKSYQQSSSGTIWHLVSGD